MFNNSPSDDNEYIIAAISYFPFFSLILIVSSWKKQYFIKYHAGHAIIIYTLSLLVLLAYILMYILIRSLIKDAFLLDLAWGLLFSIHLLANFIYIFYCSILAYQGKYLMLPGITKLFYFLFNR